MKRMVESVSRGIFLILLGTVFLLINFNYLSWGFWWNIGNLWPLILILTGIGLLLSKKIPFTAVLSVFLIFLIGYSLIYGNRSNPFDFTNWEWSTDGAKVETALNVPANDQIKKVKLVLDLGGSALNIDALDEQQEKESLLDGKFYGPNSNLKPELKTEQSGDTMSVKFDTDGMSLRGTGKWDVGLSSKPDYDMNIDAGAINGVLDFSRLKVGALNLDTGASNFELHFGDMAVSSKVRIDSAASKIKLIIPESVGIKVRIDGMATSTNFMGSGLVEDGKTWVSSNYDQAQTKIDFDISMAAGNIELEQP